VAAAIVEESVAVSSAELLEPWVRQALAAAGENGQTVVLSLDQTD